MTREDAKQLLPIIQAFSEGKEIEGLYKGTKSPWFKIKDMHFNEGIIFRIKPETKYRPFKDIEECWSEMQKHQPFGWIKNGGYWYNIITTGVMSVKIIDTRGAIATLYFSDLLAHYRFADGTTFGVKIEDDYNGIK